MRPAARRRVGGCLRKLRLTRPLLGLAAASLSLSLSMPAAAQAPETRRDLMAPPVSHETGRIDEVIDATDNGYRSRQYVLTWRSMRIVVAGAPGDSRRPGDNLDVLVYRSEANGLKVLRFESDLAVSNENVVDADSAASSASITLGTAPVEAGISAETDGYRFVGYFVTWHNQRVFVVDPRSAPARATGETINFRAIHTGVGASRLLSFSL